MDRQSENSAGLDRRAMLDLFIEMGLLIVAVGLCWWVFAPFMPIMLWGLILAVSLYPLLNMLRARTGWAPGRSATALILVIIVVVGVPSVLLGSSFATHVFDVVGDFDAKALTLDPPSESVREWPVIGERVYAAWSQASSDLPGYLESIRPQLRNFSKAALGAAASTAGTLLFFLGALIVAGIMMAYGESGTLAMRRIFSRLAGAQKGPQLHVLTTLTVRSVATGVVGVAVIEGLILGIGFIIAGVPAAGLLAIVTVVVCLIQLPTILVSAVGIAYLWGPGEGGTVFNIALTAYLILGGFADNVFKPILLGRGVDVPMPVVLIGALGGMVSAGVIGLFVGAVILSVGYQLFMDWVDEAQPPAAQDPDAQAGSEPEPRG